jgi:hypothetical protein
MLPDRSSGVNIPDRITRLAFFTNKFIDEVTNLLQDRFQQDEGSKQMLKKFWNSNLIDALALVTILYFMAR